MYEQQHQETGKLFSIYPCICIFSPVWKTPPGKKYFGWIHPPPPNFFYGLFGFPISWKFNNLTFLLVWEGKKSLWNSHMFQLVFVQFKFVYWGGILKSKFPPKRPKCAFFLGDSLNRHRFGFPQYVIFHRHELAVQNLNEHELAGDLLLLKLKLIILSLAS